MGGWERDINQQKSKLEKIGLWTVTLSGEMRDKGLPLARDAVSKNCKHEALILPSGCKYCVCVQWYELRLLSFNQACRDCAIM